MRGKGKVKHLLEVRFIFEDFQGRFDTLSFFEDKGSVRGPVVAAQR